MLLMVLILLCSFCFIFFIRCCIFIFWNLVGNFFMFVLVDKFLISCFIFWVVCIMKFMYFCWGFDKGLRFWSNSCMKFIILCRGVLRLWEIVCVYCISFWFIFFILACCFLSWWVSLVIFFRVVCCVFSENKRFELLLLEGKLVRLSCNWFIFLLGFSSKFFMKKRVWLLFLKVVNFFLSWDFLFLILNMIIVLIKL